MDPTGDSFHREGCLSTQPRGKRQLGRVALAALEQVRLGPAKLAQCFGRDSFSLGSGGFHYEMVMVPHEAIGIRLPIGLLAGLGQCLEETVTIYVIQKNVLTPISATHDGSPP